MTDEDGFLGKLLENPTDDTQRLIYADWLEERDTPEATAKATFLRALAQLRTSRKKRKPTTELKAKLAELARPLPTGWLAVVSHLDIENCRANPPRVALGVIHINPPPRFDYECPKEWSALTVTDDPAVRYCGACEQNVYYSDTIVEARKHAVRGRCIAIDCAIPRADGDLRPPRRLMGKMMPNAVHQARQQEGERVRPDEVSAEREARKPGRRRAARTGFEGGDE